MPNFLIEKSADVNAISAEGKTALHELAVKCKFIYWFDWRISVTFIFFCLITQKADNDEIARLLIKSGANVNTEDAHKATPLHDTAKTGNSCKLLFEI